jgi:hypothetical protein
VAQILPIAETVQNPTKPPPAADFLLIVSPFACCLHGYRVPATPSASGTAADDDMILMSCGHVV